MLKKTNRFIFFLSLCAYASVFVPPDYFWLAGFAALSIPIFILTHVFLFTWQLQRKEYKLLWWSGLGLAAAFPFIAATIGFSLPEPTEGNENTFSVLSYNVRVFNIYNHPKSRRQYEVSDDLVEWAVKDNADIKCFQEFFDLPGKDWIRTRHRFEREGLYYSYFEPTTGDDHGGQFGTAIFSRFPIVGKGILDFKNSIANNAVYADLKIENDTVRVYNIHLQSMSIDERNFTSTEAFTATSWNNLKRFKGGMQARAEQIRELLEHMEEAKCKRIILCGDLNDLPYSYTYYRLRMSLKNSFESGGNGFGFSYNGLLFFLRIDNQFYSADKLKLHKHNTHREVKFSDHFPIKTEFSVSE